MIKKPTCYLKGGSMNRLVLTAFVLMLLSCCLELNAQLSTREVPVGFQYDFGVEIMPTINLYIQLTNKFKINYYICNFNNIENKKFSYISEINNV